MYFDLTSWSILVHLGAMIQIIGYFFRDQLTLRFLLLIGTVFYLLYYLLSQETPLWDALFWSAIILMVNLFVLLNIISDRMVLFKDQEQTRIFRLFHGFTPGMYRKLIKGGKFIRADTTTQLCLEGHHLNKLYFIAEGSIRINKQGRSFNVLPGTFVGEVVFLSGGTASASIIILPGTCYYEWKHEQLKKLLKHSPELKVHLETLMNQDMALKIRHSRLEPRFSDYETNDHLTY